MIRTIDLFSGAGGFTARLDKNLFSVGYALDMDPAAQAVYRRNRPDTSFLLEDVSCITDFKALMKHSDILLAGPPCQGFSLVGMKTKPILSAKSLYDPAKDPRNLLPLEVPRVAKQMRPEIIIMENVPAMNNQYVKLEGKYTLIVSAVRNSLEHLGYMVTEPFILEASKLGIAQRRKRSFIVATLNTLVSQTEITKAQEVYFQHHGNKNLSDAIKDLVSYPMGHTKSKIIPSYPDHIGRVPNSDDLKIIRNLRPGEDYKSLLERMPEVVAGRIHKTYSLKSFKDKFYRLSWSAPSRTIVAHLQKDGNSFIHPSLNRSISVREAARIQSFNDDFSFGVAMVPAYRLIGNAVPPLMGKFLVETVSRITGLLNEKTSETSQYAGLVS